jgi:signal transduction histidine kinase/ActR/RegA family two-component response regulator
MTLRRTTLLIISAALGGLLITFFFASRFILLPRFARLESHEVEQQVKRAQTAVQSDMDQLGTIAHDDSQWDEAYEYVLHPTPAFLESNLPPSFFDDAQVDLLEYLDMDRHVLYQYEVGDAESGHSIPAAEQRLLLRPDLLADSSRPGKVIRGLLMLPDGPMLVAAAPVTRSSAPAAAVGTFIVGRKLNANRVHRLSLLTRLDLKLYAYDSPALPPDVANERGSLSRLHPVAVLPLNNTTVRGYGLINDLSEQPALILAVGVPRDIHEEGDHAEIFVMLSALAVGIAFSLLTMFLMEQLVLARLVGLGKRVAAIGARGDPAARVPHEGQDEISELAAVINRMLGNLAEAERERLRDRERYRAYVTQSTEGIWLAELKQPMSLTLPEDQQIQHLRQHLFVTDCNDALARLHGFASADQMRGLPMTHFNLLKDPRNREVVFRIVRSSYRITDGESVKVEAHGHTRYFLNNVSGVVEQGCLVRIWGTQREVTEQRQLEAQLRHAQKMEAVGRLAGGVAHDFNNLLSVIHGYSELMLARFYPGSPEHKEAQQVLHATERAATLTRQLLALGRKQVMAPRIVDLNSVVYDIYPLLRRLVREDVEFVSFTEPQLWRVKADPSQLEQVLVNLVVNASDATPAGGCVRIETRNVDLGATDSLAGLWLAPGEYVQLTVSDTGVGMDSETRARIFEPFFSTKVAGKGTGLGLATVYGIVRQSGGHISVNSEPGTGSAFTVHLPRTHGTPEPAVEDTPSRSTPKRSGTLLLVEDDPAVRQLARQILQARGYTVHSASSGYDALNIAAENRCNIDLVVTDVIMPGMAGDELVARLRETRPDLGVVFVSGYASDSIPNIVTDARTAFLQKPFPVEELVRKVYDLMEVIAPQRMSG